MSRRLGAKTVLPSIPPHRAIDLLTRQLSRLEDLVDLRFDDPRVRAWENATEQTLEQAFGQPSGSAHANSLAFLRASGGPVYVGMPEYEWQQNHVNKLALRKELLRSAIEQLHDLAPPSTLGAEDNYRLHPDVERVSGQLYRDRHYKQAALEAYILVIDAVKRYSNLSLDGDPLMNQAFGCDNRAPAIQLNSLASDAERDEQRGFMYLFKGIVALRNSKAHSNRLFNDPSRGYEYLALASVLLRILELAKAAN